MCMCCMLAGCVILATHTYTHTCTHIYAHIYMHTYISQYQIFRAHIFMQVKTISGQAFDHIRCMSISPFEDHAVCYLDGDKLTVFPLHNVDGLDEKVGDVALCFG